LLIAPVTEQGRVSREVYLPAGVDWYNFWTNGRVHGGQTLTVAAPIEIIPIFVHAGSVVPLGEPVESTNEVQRIATLRVYSGADADLDLYQDDGTTYNYEKGELRANASPLV
jgi:alpha-D-xyloside xylohydrolase